MTDSQIIDDLFISRMFLNKSSGAYGNLNVVLDEPDEKRSRVTIDGLPQDAIIIKVDNFPALNNVFNGVSGECSRCDYLIFSESDRCIIFIEIKNSTDKEYQLVKQLRGGLRFLKYLQLILDFHKGISDFASDYKIRYVSFLHTDTTLNKRPMKQFPSQLHDSPENMWKYTTGNKAVKYKQIASLNR